MAEETASSVRRVFQAGLVLWLTFCMILMANAQQDLGSTETQECRTSGPHLTVEVDPETRTATFTCDAQLKYLWPATKKPKEEFTEYFLDDTCNQTGKLSSKFGEGTTLRKNEDKTAASNSLKASGEMPIAYTLTVARLTDSREKAFFKCAKAEYSSLEKTTTTTEAESCVVTVIVPPAPTPAPDTCTPEREALSLTITKPGENATFKCGEKNSTLLPSEPRVFSEDCQTDQALDAAIPSAKLESQDGAHTLTVPKLPKAGTVICYKCVDQADKAAEQCSVKIRVSACGQSAVEFFGFNSVPTGRERGRGKLLLQNQ
ncbi:SAG-related sequence [Besnoitia besnoiti]|uniref:SAG-related sequence n=1 Tax=Besnoitia besnoiti TaxID=94643 RepID=A0A2A9MI85_BESBE|nr:SAG-related sequence [Besnoitia besnoiti]PFH35343.1 SAG-related sequence [Besnoitia besnoiti]